MSDSLASLSANANAVADEVAPEPNTCFAESRRLTGSNRFFRSTAAVLEPLGRRANDSGAHRHWQALVLDVAKALGWPHALSRTRVQSHAGGTMLVLAAPSHLLFTATEICEWAWEIASDVFADPLQPERNAEGVVFERIHDFSAAQAADIFRAKVALETVPALVDLVAAAHARALPVLVDDDTVSIGIGDHSAAWPRVALPRVENVPWPGLADAPVALVTGSNGKTTTVRLIAAMLRATGHHVGYSCTEGVFVDGVAIESGDYSGPAGARTVLRNKAVNAAVLETARGGLLRRGLAVESATVAVVTNVSADHFGEYGIDSLEDLADVKLTVARVLGERGTLVLNADDAVLLTAAARHVHDHARVALFAHDHNHPALVAHRLRPDSGATCGVDLATGELVLSIAGARVGTDAGVAAALGQVASMPLTIGGVARYNIGNIAAAALAATALGVSTAQIARTLGRFGSVHSDNDGRLSRWQIAGVTVLMDYAHNPDGLAGLLNVARALLSADGRLSVLLGQAGNRDDDAIAELAMTAAKFHPARIVIKEIASMLRGRAPGDVPERLHTTLLAAGIASETIERVDDEAVAAKSLLAWAKPGDVVVLPIHQKTVRVQMSQFLDVLLGEHAPDQK